jgi:DNA repair protein RadC
MSVRSDALVLRRALGLSPNVAPTLRRALADAGGLLAVLAGDPERLAPVSPRAVRRLRALAALLEHVEAAPLPSTRLTDADAVAAYFRRRLATVPVESFWALFLDARLGVTGEACIARGTLTACLVHPREVFAAAIRRRAAQLILVHNHPSGDPTPSAEDLSLTERMSEVGALVGIPVVDHVVVARGGHRSIGVPPPRGPRGLRHARVEVELADAPPREEGSGGGGAAL